ncbi:MAG: carboxypeptidase regulatory-like domain-containing protein [Bacteroidetes bacterium]|nr:carboxypeptidase regulatory-like domain-containing protein [Bacteroidota bacterium]
MNKALYTIILLMLTINALNGQVTYSDRYIQVSGIISDEANRLVSGAAIISKKLKKGTVSEGSGIYSITSTPGDTVFFRALGYKRYHTIIPQDYGGQYANVDIRLEFDTVKITGVNILPWRTYSEFIRDITQDKPVDPIIENMNENLASIYVALQNEIGLKISPEAGYNYVVQQDFNAHATKNQFPVNNLMNPWAWSKFIKGVKNGLFKNQKFNRPVEPKVRKKVKNAENK